MKTMASVSAALFLLLSASLHGNDLKRSVDHAGHYRITQSRDDAVCKKVVDEINRDIDSGNSFPPSKSSIFLPSRRLATENVSGLSGLYLGEPVDVIVADLGSDGRQDMLVITKWQLGNSIDDIGYVLFGQSLSLPLSYEELVREGFEIRLNGGSYVHDQVQRYGESLAVDWLFSGNPRLAVARVNHRSFIVARSVVPTPLMSSKVYVFEIDRKHTRRDVCMAVAEGNDQLCNEFSSLLATESGAALGKYQVVASTPFGSRQQPTRIENVDIDGDDVSDDIDLSCPASKEPSDGSPHGRAVVRRQVHFQRGDLFHDSSARKVLPDRLCGPGKQLYELVHAERSRANAGLPPSFIASPQSVMRGAQAAGTM